MLNVYLTRVRPILNTFFASHSHTGSSSFVSEAVVTEFNSGVTEVRVTRCGS